MSNLKFLALERKSPVDTKLYVESCSFSSSASALSTSSSSMSKVPLRTGLTTNPKALATLRSEQRQEYQNAVFSGSQFLQLIVSELDVHLKVLHLQE